MQDEARRAELAIKEAELWAFCPHLRGKRVADIPELAGHRYKYRGKLYRWAEVHFGFAVFNIAIASALGFPWRQLNLFAAAVAVGMMFFSELYARVMSRQLRRSAIEQAARDLLGVRG